MFNTMDLSLYLCIGPLEIRIKSQNNNDSSNNKTGQDVCTLLPETQTIGDHRIGFRKEKRN